MEETEALKRLMDEHAYQQDQLAQIIGKSPTTISVLCKPFNHSSPAITMRYLGIEDKGVHNILMNEVG